MRRRGRDTGMIVRGVAILLPTVTLGLVGSFSMVFQGSPAPGVHRAVLADLRRAAAGPEDEKTLELVRHAQQDLDSWAATATGLLQRGERTAGPELTDPQDRIRQIRDVYAWTTTTPEFTRALLVLADAHSHRLEAIQEMARSGAIDERTYSQVEADVDAVWSGIQSWVRGR